MSVPASWSLLTPGGPGAIAIIQIEGDAERVFSTTGIKPVAVGRFGLRDFFGIDRGLAARPAHHTLQLMPHAGTHVVRAIGEALTRSGVPEDRHGVAGYPEAATSLEARMLDAIARAASPLAIDLLADQPRRWAESGTPDPSADHSAADDAHSATLRRLLTPPLVAAIGPANVGKSTLLNALAGRSVALVADEPGTTRDHVGVLLDLAGLVVRYADCPGLRETDSRAEREAVEIALALVRAADLVLLCGDAGTPPPAIDLPPTEGVLRVALRADLGLPAWHADAVVCAQRAEGVAALAALIRERLVPRSMLDDPRPWKFW